MQILKVFSIRDAKAEIYMTPFIQKSHGEAERTFKEAVKNENSLIGKYPEDYDLYLLGEFNDSTGKMEILDTPQHVIKGVALKTQS